MYISVLQCGAGWQPHSAQSLEQELAAGAMATLARSNNQPQHDAARDRVRRDAAAPHLLQQPQRALPLLALLACADRGAARDRVRRDAAALNLCQQLQCQSPLIGFPVCADLFGAILEEAHLAPLVWMRPAPNPTAPEPLPGTRAPIVSTVTHLTIIPDAPTDIASVPMGVMAAIAINTATALPRVASTSVVAIAPASASADVPSIPG